jgi:pimeloyl-ACP methyl ester carboxylesterase
MVGKGPDVILIPGLSSSPEVWRSTVEAVPGYRYHLIHVAGFAGKAAAANGSGPVLAPVADEIARYVRESKLRRPALIGHSLGGAWAMMVASSHPKLASRVMVVDMLPFLGAMFAGPSATPESVKPMAEQIRAGIASGTGEARRKITEQTIAGMVRTEAMRPALVRHSLDSDAATSAQAMYELVTTDQRPALAKVKVPLTVLFVTPAGAPVTDAQMEQFYKLSYAAAPQAVLKRVPDAYHFIMLDAPDAFRAELKAFLKR